VLARNTGPSSLVLSPTVNGSIVAVSATFADPDVLDTHTVTMSWGDGTTTWTLAAGATSFNASHTYTTSGTYTLDATVTDPSGASANASVQVVVTVSGGTAAELLDQMSGLVLSFELDRTIERWLLRRIDELKASLSTGDTQLCADLKTLGKLSAFASRTLSPDQYAVLSALATKLEAAAQCSATNLRPTGEPRQKTPIVKPTTPTPLNRTSADKDKSDKSEKQDEQTKSGRGHADRSEGRD
jgi:PKD repeat protein